jgi:hypothetical protein
MNDEDEKKANHDAVDVILDAGEELADTLISEHEEGCYLHDAAVGIKSEAQSLRVQNARARVGSGPAMVASAAYRSGWETLFGQKTKAGSA